MLFEPKVKKDTQILAKFVHIYCRKNHDHSDKTLFTCKIHNSEALELPKMDLCEDCSKLLNHGVAKRAMCPLNPKPMCKKCPNHCYHPAYRENMRQVMKFSGIYLAKRGRLDMLIHYLA